MSRAAALLGKDDDARQFSELAEKIRAAFNEKFYDATRRFYATGSQTANSIPLVMGICDPANRAAVLDAIVRDVRQHGNALTAGDVGYRYLLRALADGGRSDVIFDINNQSEKPGYGYQLKMGATSLTEAWNAGVPRRRITSCSARSRNGFTTTSPASRTLRTARVSKKSSSTRSPSAT